MGMILSINGYKETILEPEKDLDILIENYLGTDARDLYRRIITRYKDRAERLQKQANDAEEHKERLEATIDDGRWEIGQILDLMDGEVDLADIRRRLKNLEWELDY